MLEHPEHPPLDTPLSCLFPEHVLQFLGDEVDRLMVPPSVVKRICLLIIVMDFNVAM